MGDANNISRETAAYVNAGMVWTCPNCGRPNKNTSRFCGGCGAVKPEINMQNTMSGGYGAYIPPEEVRAPAAPQKSSSGGIKILAAIIAAILLIAAIGFGIWHFLIKDKAEPEQVLAGDQTEQSANAVADNAAQGNEPETSKAADPSYNPNAADPEASAAIDEQEKNQEKFKVGNTYTVVVSDGVIVRRAPKREEGNELKYSELTPEYQAQADSRYGESAIACLNNGAKVTCLEMSGDWMRIQEGAWVCTYFDKETLIK